MTFKTPMTIRGHRELQEELKRLKGVERVKCSKAIEEARAHGDLSENAEYEAAKQAQGFLEAKIRDIESKLSTAQVVDVATLSGEKVVFGATVTVGDLESDEQKKFAIVGDDEADVNAGLISYQSPLARACIGKSVGDILRVKLPAGEREYELLSVEFIERND